MDHSRRKLLQGGAGAGLLFLPLPYAWVWAQSEGTLKLVRAPKVALVIGNGKYKHASELRNPANDATAIGEMLKASGFEVAMKIDASRAEMTSLIQAYAQTLAAKKCVGLFYFAGHGLQLAWRNYLVPVEANIEGMGDVARQCVEVGSLIGGLTQAANPMNMVILDACRENPFGKDFRDAHKGLSQMDAPPATLLAYATSPGNVASDGAGSNGLYTEHLLQEIQVKEAKIEDVFKRVRLGVRRKSRGAQIPWESTSLEEDFYFFPPAEMKKRSEAEQKRLFEEERVSWEKVKGAMDPGPLVDYLTQYPTGNFSELAQLQLDRVLARQGEKKVAPEPAEGNPFTKGSATANTAFKVGDRYTYQQMDHYSKVVSKTWSETVVEITDTEVRFSDGRVLDLLGNPLRLRDGRRLSGAQPLPLEYAVGKRWQNHFEQTLRDGTVTQVELKMKIVARERITVPAGTFDAFRIEARGESIGPNGVLEVEVNIWRAPEKVRLLLVREEIRRARGSVVHAERVELVAFEQS